ncbi:MAG TPA: ribbon-helix-helix protein, CopG family [Phycisphaerae bacterium]|nr:ribbon-helix-helix protein, CopG family [Phycisphaerae bacterium]
MPAVTISFRIPADLASKLEAEARKTGVSKSAIVRDALVKYLPRMKSRR